MKLPLHILEMKNGKYEVMDNDGLYQCETPLKSVAEEIVEIVNMKGCCYYDCKRND